MPISYAQEQRLRSGMRNAFGATGLRIAGYPELALADEVENIGRTNVHSLILPGRRLLVVGSVRRIIGGLYFREPFQAGGVDLCYPVLERCL
jgi:hypothetical protein